MSSARRHRQGGGAIGATFAGSDSAGAAAVPVQAEATTQTWLTQPQAGGTAGHSTAVQACGGGGVGAVFAMHMPQQPAAARNAQSVSTLHAFGPASGGGAPSVAPPSRHIPWYATVTFAQAASHEFP